MYYKPQGGSLLERNLQHFSFLSQKIKQLIKITFKHVTLFSA